MSCVGCTGELTEESKYEWKIANFFSLSAPKGSYYTSPTFVFGNTFLRLNIYPAGDEDAKSGFLSLFLENTSGEGYSIDVYNTLHIKKADGTLTMDDEEDVCIISETGYSDFYERSRLQQNQSEMVPSGTLTIVCILQSKELNRKKDITKGEQIEKIDKKQAHKGSDHRKLAELDVLSENLKDLSTNKDSCDTILQVKDKEFKAHKAILMARSPVFGAMFQHDTSEKQSGFIDIPDCDPESFQEFLDYLYCGKLEDVSYRSACHLYITSDKYDVQKLKEYCVKYLIESLTADNVCDIVKLADQYDDEKIMLAAQDFFNENWSEVFATTEWKSLLKNDCRLVDKLLMELSKAKGPQQKHLRGNTCVTT